jgi:hypothetical protein
MLNWVFGRVVRCDGSEAMEKMGCNKEGVDLLLCIWWLSGLVPLQNITERELQYCG